ncbi:MAG: tRNA 2-thiouridine(34) synthase MnmA [Planctomycetaceae bacterium]|nr:tRNA 2-thiouridine(34) synthase MnmA [Planctomycetaceae bacterium]
MSHVILAMSGGVDSTVAATLLLQQGYRVTGVYMSHPWQAESDFDHVFAVARHLGIDCRVVDLTAVFQKLVNVFADEYFAARTPNPCALCNREIKFGLLFDEMRRLGGDFLATGHYIRTVSHEQWLNNIHAVQAEPIAPSLACYFDAGVPAICRGNDPGKDQSYIMYGVDRNKLSQVMFPIGNHTKSQIRELASDAGFDFSQKRESQEICFVPDREHVRFINTLRPDHASTAGNLVSVDGTVLGTHDGFEKFTVGQRKGMRVGFSGRRYVVRLDAETNDVVIGTQDDLQCRELAASQCNWLICPPREPFRCLVKIRYRSPATLATVTPLDHDRIHVLFDEARHAVAPGQIAACYLSDRILGGGIIL